MKLKELLEVVDDGDLDFYDISTGEDDDNPNAHISGKRVLTYKKTCEKLLECTITKIKLKGVKVYVTVYPYLE